MAQRGLQRLVPRLLSSALGGGDLRGLGGGGSAGAEPGGRGETRTSPSDHFKRGEAHLKHGKLERAVEEFERAFAGDGSLVWAPINAGTALMHLKRYDEALRMLARAISVAPRNPHAINAVGNVYLAKGSYAQALGAFNAALAQDSTLAPVHYNRAVALHNLGASEEALRSYRRALELKLALPEVYSGLGAALLELGDFDQAREAFGAALARDPKNVQTLSRWLDMRKVDVNDPHLRTLRSLARRVDTLALDEQIELHFALAKVEADLGKNAESFEQLLLGNAKKRGTIEYNEPYELAFYLDAERTFTPELLREKGGGGNPSHAPIFVIGMPRSGTTLIEQILASHPSVAAGGERSDVHGVMNDTSLQLQRAFPQWIGLLPPAAFAELGTRYLGRVGSLATANERFTDKMPSNVLYAGLIHLMFPNARIIHVRRDAVDTCVSCFSCLFSEAQPQTYDLAELGRYYLAYDRLSAHWRTVLPPHAYIEIQYEDVVADIETQARRIIEHAGLEWNPCVLEFYNTRRSVRTASVQQVRKPIYSSSVGRSRRYGDRLAPLLEALGLGEQRVSNQ